MRFTTGLISIVAADTSTLAWTLTPGTKTVIKSITAMNRTAGDGVLRIGYQTNGGVWVQVSTDLLILDGITAMMNEWDIPVMGNTVDGFCYDLTPVLGCTGIIYLRSDVGGAAPLDVQVIMEIDDGTP